MGFKADLVAMTMAHNGLRERSNQHLPEDECMLWYKLPYGREKSFDDIAHLYKTTYFLDMANELNLMGIGSRLNNGQMKRKEGWQIQHFSLNKAREVKIYALLAMFDALDTDLNSNVFLEYVSQRAQGNDPSIISARVGLRKKEVTTDKYR